ncbi:sugar nucleotide-binding protein [Metallosphaera tengchongensis]|uniref:Sugar nucleotide-binding protein n=1 Tax=Metallosphaera tengchongensis TaxID=1532350 RepID=A0A6N0NYE2_9CREN|nr:sugar nucleotide-binding protein [Metallosphaera tengchongensis]QKR00398.1 sugar nucleotide-binding protein [Metallosphaera tengchongensis]
MRVAVTDEGEVSREIASSGNWEVVVIDSPNKVYQVKPDVIVHTFEIPYYEAGTRRDKAWTYNAWMAINIAKSGHKIGALNVYLSSFMIFNGRRGFYEETSTPEPLNYYGITKLAGEIGISALGNYLVLRTGAIFSLSYRGFLFNHIRSLLLKGRAVCNREFYLSLVSTRSLGRVISSLLSKGATGVINVGGRISQCEALGEIAKYSQGHVIEREGPKMDFSLDDWLLRTFGIKTSPKNEIRETFVREFHDNERKDTVVT